MGNFTKKIVSKTKLLHNVDLIKSALRPNCRLCAMVKANAYGHGLRNVVEMLKDDVDFFGVANLTEALEVKKISNEKDVLIVGRTSDFEK